MVAAAKAASSGQFAVIDHEMRFTAAVQAARKVIFEDKVIGELLHFDMHQVRHARNEVGGATREK